MSSENRELSKMKPYIDKECEICGRKYPHTILNVEGFIHHGNQLVCLNQKDCKKALKKKMRKDI